MLAAGDMFALGEDTPELNTGILYCVFPEHRVLAAGDMFAFGEDTPELNTGILYCVFPEHRVLAAGDMFAFGEDTPELNTGILYCVNSLSQLRLRVACGPPGTRLTYDIYIYISTETRTIDFRR